jgi:molecular chaperone IbpA
MNNLTINTRTIPALLDRINREFVGFDDLLSTIQNVEFGSNGFPPYNIIRDGENNFEVVLAVAGFTPDEVDVSIENNTLTVSGTKTSEIENFEERVFLHKGIAFRDFKREFRLGQYLEVAGAEFKNGLLTIKLVRNVPEAMKPRRIEIKQV